MLARLLTICAALLWAGVAVPQDFTKAAGNAGGLCNRTIGPGNTCYLQLTNTLAGDSDMFRVTYYADVKFDPDASSERDSTAEITVEHCVTGSKGVNTCDTVCVDVDGDGAVDDGILNGDPGDVSGEQRHFIYDLGPGLYYIATPTNPGVGEVGTVIIRGHR